MNVEKLPSGSYRVRRVRNGRRFSVTFDHKPSVKEAEKALQELMNRPRYNGSMKFEEVAKMFMQDKSNVLSPATLRGYRNNLNGLSDWFKSLRTDDITQLDVQREINSLAGRLAPKTVKNYHGFISSVLGLYRPDLKLHTQLPMVINEEPYIPNMDELKALFDKAKGTKYLLCLYLGSMGMRRSEICALSLDDFEGNVLHIRKSMVQNEKDEWVVKPYPKTSASARDIFLPDEVIREVEEHGLYKGHPHTISDWMRRAQDDLGMKRFSLHKLRHFFASNAHELGLSDAMIQSYGGWQTDIVMKRVYRHATASSQKVSDAVGASLFSSPN